MRLSNIFLGGIAVQSAISVMAEENGENLDVKTSEPVLSDNTNFCKVNKDDFISDACDVTFQEINEMNNKIRPKLLEVVNSDFFKYFKLNLYTECPFWEDNNGYCVNRACAVDVIEDNWDELPEYWKPEFLGKLNSTEESMIIPDQCDDAQEEFLNQLCQYSNGLKNVYKRDIEYCDVDTLTNHESSVLVDLTANPERFTGYGGEQSGLIWGSIYRENCFDVSDNEGEQKCLAKDAFYRLVSGMHASIATHLSNDYLDTKTGEWGPNLDLFMNRVGYFPDRVANIYFNYAVVSKAVFKISGYLKDLDFCEAYDNETMNKIYSIATDIDTRIFNEHLLFQNDVSSDLKDQFRARFKNVTKIMDCVHCDRCRLWGKVQTTGYATSLKILFEMDEFDSEAVVNGLTKYELIALMNTYDRISKSVASINNFEKLYHEKNDGFFQRNNIFRLLDKARKNWLSSSSSEVVSSTTLEETATKEEPKFEDVILPPPKETSESSDISNQIQTAWNEEIENFKGAFRFIFQSYWEFPKNISRLFMLKFNKLWNDFIGVEDYMEKGYKPKRQFYTKLPFGRQ